MIARIHREEFENLRPITIRYATNCRQCGGGLHEGRRAFGCKSPIDSRSRWIFVCDMCEKELTKSFEAVGTKRLTKVDISLADEKAAIEKVDVETTKALFDAFDEKIKKLAEAELAEKALTLDSTSGFEIDPAKAIDDALAFRKARKMLEAQMAADKLMGVMPEAPEEIKPKTEITGLEKIKQQALWRI